MMVLPENNCLARIKSCEGILEADTCCNTRLDLSPAIVIVKF